MQVGHIKTRNLTQFPSQKPSSKKKFDVGKDKRKQTEENKNENEPSIVWKWNELKLYGQMKNMREWAEVELLSRSIARRQLYVQKYAQLLQKYY